MALHKALFASAITACIAIGPLSAQQASPRATTPAASVPAPALDPSEVHIDHNCRVLTPSRITAKNPNPAPRYHYNSIVCHFESEHSSSHWEQTTVNGVPKYIHVLIKEREYLLQNVTNSPVTFIVDQTLLKGWRIDSDPQPTEVNGSLATFRVRAQPGQIVRLHVGARSS